jgi:hypothetical protein
MKMMFPKFFGFYPTTFHLPFQFAEFQREHLRLSGKGTPITWIVKPRNGCCGNGIRLIQNSFDVANENQQAIVQRYISPFLLDGFKFDFRFYILVASLHPFSFYVYKEGLSRFCTHPYRAPLRETLTDRFCHLTNTAVNVGNSSSTNPILELASTVIDRIVGLDQRGVNLWVRIKRVILLSILSQTQNIVRNMGQLAPEIRISKQSPAPGPDLDDFHRFFHILGIDIMLNDRCEPMVLELNDRPSMSVTYDIEQPLKSQLIRDALNLITVDGTPPPDSVSPGAWEKMFPDPNSAFGREADDILSRCCMGSFASPSKMVVRRLGYVPSKSTLSRPYRRSLGLPPLQQ